MEVKAECGNCGGGPVIFTPCGDGCDWAVSSKCDLCGIQHTITHDQQCEKCDT